MAMEAKMEIMPMTTRSSMRVKPVSLILFDANFEALS